jgi:neutral ceramidase
MQTPVVYDGVPSGRAFGSVLLDVRTSAPYHAGDTVRAVFLGANPRVSDLVLLW